MVQGIALGITISIHPPREGWDTQQRRLPRWKTFQSTHPVRGGTSLTTVPPAWVDFNPPTP